MKDGRADVLRSASEFAGWREVLDEGVDGPDANLGIILAASRTRRRIIQRLGPTLRDRADRGQTHLALFVASNTSEDLASSTHLELTAPMLDVADQPRSIAAPTGVGRHAPTTKSTSTLPDRCRHRTRPTVGTH